LSEDGTEQSFAGDFYPTLAIDEPFSPFLSSLLQGLQAFSRQTFVIDAPFFNAAKKRNRPDITIFPFFSSSPHFVRLLIRGGS